MPNFLASLASRKLALHTAVTGYLLSQARWTHATVLTALYGAYNVAEKVLAPPKRGR